MRPTRHVIITRAIAAVAALMASMTVTTMASSNGRFPEANHVVLSPLHPSDQQEILLRVSFGLLISRDGGKSFGWVCEQALDLAESEDPMYAYSKSGKLVSSTYRGTVVSTDRGCSWPKVPSVADKLFVDLAQRRDEVPNVLNQDRRIVVFESGYESRMPDGGAVVYKSQLYETSDDAVTFVELGTRLNSQLFGYTVDLAPNDPQRVYVSAVLRLSSTNAHGVLVASSDRGTTWIEHAIPFEENERAIFLGAVDPTNANRIYLRTSSSALGTSPTKSQSSRVLLSEDGGVTFRTIFKSQGALLGFALSRDGSKVYVGGPKDGLHVATSVTNGDFAFRKTSSVEVQCITAAPDSDRLWVCSAETSGFILAYTKDEGASFEGKVHFRDITGPLDCPHTPPFDQCVTGWSRLRASLGLASQGNGEEDAASDAAIGIPVTVLTARGSGCSASPTDESLMPALLGGCCVLGIASVLVGRHRRRARRSNE